MVLQHNASSSLKIEVQNVEILCDVSTGTPHPLVPDTVRLEIFSASHPGVRSTRGIISVRFVGKNLNSDVKIWCESCEECWKGKNYRHIRAEVQTNPIPSRQFSHIHVDIVGPLPCFNGFSHVFTIIDRPTR